IINMVNIEKDEKITAVTHVKEFSEKRFLFLITKKGIVKKISLEELKNLRSTGIKVISLPEDDSLVEVLETNGENEVMLGTKKGMTIRFSEKEIRQMGRQAYGVKGIRLRTGDEVVSAKVVSEDSLVFTVTEKGYGKCTPCSEYRGQSRGGTGIINVKCRQKNGDVVHIKEINQGDEVILVTDTGRTIRFHASDLPVQKRGGIGVKLMDLKEGEKISDVAIASED
ncbi:MAG TPA: DNA gyrase C-terminal beta-propeller domain-containing protein, partial [Syntrophorhabdaceae bacterium]|nr:DNA gyrase C-terminal beta-propeller domain-containing protein [Syntrophorhabdaceae bacterium]